MAGEVAVFVPKFLVVHCALSVVCVRDYSANRPGMSSRRGEAFAVRPFDAAGCSSKCFAPTDATSSCYCLMLTG